MTNKPLSFETSRQFRPTLVRLKKLAEQGLDDAPASIATCLDLTPRHPMYCPGSTKIWRPAKIGKIAATFDVVWGPDIPLLVYPNCRIATTHEDAVLILQDMFGPVNEHWSPSGKGWSVEFALPVNCRRSLVVLFDKPSKKDHQTLFRGALIRPT